MGIIFASAPVASILFGSFKGRFNFTTRYQELSFKHLPKAFNGLRIVHISDLHLGSFKGNEAALQKAVEMINRENPHLIVFTGDLVNNFFVFTKFFYIFVIVNIFFKMSQFVTPLWSSWWITTTNIKI